MITGDQLRAARALADLSLDRLSELAGVHRNTISNIERGSVGAMQGGTLDALTVALAKHGVEFTQSGVQFRQDSVSVLEGKDAIARLREDMLKALPNGGEILWFGAVEGKVDEENSKFLLKLKNHGISERLLIQEGDTNFIHPAECYHWVPDAFFNPESVVVYGDRAARIVYGERNRVIIERTPQVETLRKSFEFIWQNTPVAVAQ